MNRKRITLWLGLLALVLLVRWLDPLGRSPSVEAASAPVERASQVAASPILLQEPSASKIGMPTWPVRAEQQDKEAGNAFMARGEVPPPVVRQVVMAAPAPVAYVPPPPTEVPPSLEVIGTWGDDSNLAVFLSGPQGTVLARQGDVILAQYRVQSITRQQLTLQQNSNQHIWNLTIPAAPSTLQTWPGR